jgi:putative ABC transport system permease protein
MRNLKFALRTLFKTPFVTIVAIVSLALGIGANAAIFSLFNQMLLRPLPVPAPDRLVNFSSPGPKPGANSCGLAGECEQVFSYPMFTDLQRLPSATSSFEGIAAHVLFGANIAARDQTSSGQSVLVSGTYFNVLAQTPALGRLLTPEDDRTIGEARVAVLSYRFWQTRFGQDPNVVNQTLIVNGETLTIVGVAPQSFDGTTLGAKPQLYVPITLREVMSRQKNVMDNRRWFWAYLFARLKPGVTAEQAQAALATPYRTILTDVEAPLQKGMSEQTMVRFKAKPLQLLPGAQGQSDVISTARAPLTLLFGVTAFVLLIACANIANLLLARSAARAGEMAVRLSLGAARWQLVGQLLSESMLLAVFGGAAGLLVARWTLDFIVSIVSKEAADTIEATLNPQVVTFSALVALGTGVAFGLFPALHSTRPDLVSSLKGQAGQPSGARAASRFRTSLATAQIALSMALLVTAGLFTRSLLNVTRVDLGLNTDHVVMFSVAPQLNGYTPERSKQLFERLEDALAAIPGATDVTAGRIALLAGNNWGNSVSVEGFKAGPDTDVNSRYNEVAPAYFATLKIPILSGREFTRADAASSAKVALVNETFAKKFNLGRDAVGKHMSEQIGNTAKLDIEIVGLVKDAKYSEVKRTIPPVFFRPYRQDAQIGDLTFYVRSAVDPTAILTAIPKVVASLDPNLPVEDLRTLPQQVRENVFLDRFISVLSAAFAALATLLAAIGLYGVLAYTISQRTREIGLRMALGAAPARVRAMVMRQVGVMTVIGGAIGLVAAIGLGKLAESLLYQLKGWDPIVLGASAVALTLVALGAGFIPALRASQVEPMIALRYE